jgi:hypothetical protein
LPEGALGTEVVLILSNLAQKITAIKTELIPLSIFYLMPGGWGNADHWAVFTDNTDIAAGVLRSWP